MGAGSLCRHLSVAPPATPFEPPYYPQSTGNCTGVSALSPAFRSPSCRESVVNQQALRELLLNPKALPRALWGHPGENWRGSPQTFMCNGSPENLVKMQILMQ